MISIAFEKDSDFYTLPRARVEGLSFGTGRHGFSDLRCTLPMSMEEAFDFYASWALADVTIRDAGGEVVWRGRLEDIAIVPEGVEVGAFGYARALGDLLYTALWSVTGTAGWRPITADEVAGVTNDRYEIDNNNRIYAAIKQNETSGNSFRAEMVYELPDAGEREAVTVSYSYELETTTGTTWLILINGYDDAWGVISSFTAAATTSTTSGSGSTTVGAGSTKIAFVFYRQAASETYTGETGETFGKLTNVRIKTTSASTVLASAIAADLAGYVAGINATQMQDDAARIVPTTLDMRNEIYEDMRPADILERIAPPNLFWWGVWEDKRLFFGSPDSGRTFVVDVAELVLESSFDEVANRVYATYTEAAGRVRRTAVANDLPSQEKLGVIRMQTTAAETTSATEAETWRDALLDDSGAYALRADVVFERLYTSSGVEVPLYALRAGDALTMRNLPPALGQAVDSIRTFRIGATKFDNDNYALAAEPDVPTPTLVTLIARRAIS